MSFPGVCWPLSRWWDAGAGDEGLEPVSLVSQGVSSAQ